MVEYNIRNIIYSDENGNIVKKRLKYYKPKTVSLGRRFINNGYKKVYRD